MFYLEDILGQGYQAHVLLYRSENRAQDADKALTVTPRTADDSTAVLIQDLMGGDISAQARTIYNSNLAISLIQTLDLGAQGIENRLGRIRKRVDQAATGVYSSLEVALLQSQIVDDIRHLDQAACQTVFRGQQLLCTDQQAVSIYLDNGHSVNVPSANLRLSGVGLNVQQDVKQARQLVSAAQVKTQAYRQVLAGELKTLRHQVGLASTMVAQKMGYGMGEPNDQVAQALTQDVVSSILSESVVALQAQANLTGNRTAWLFNGSRRPPNIMR